MHPFWRHAFKINWILAVSRFEECLNVAMLVRPHQENARSCRSSARRADQLQVCRMSEHKAQNRVLLVRSSRAYSTIQNCPTLLPYSAALRCRVGRTPLLPPSVFLSRRLAKSSRVDFCSRAYVATHHMYVITQTA